MTGPDLVRPKSNTHASGEPLPWIPPMKRALLALALAAALAGCAGVEPGPARGECSYPGAAVQCRGINPA
jgi:hypothetical protein